MRYFYTTPIFILLISFISLMQTPVMSAEDYYIDKTSDLHTILQKIKIKRPKDAVARIDLMALFYSYPGRCIGISINGDDIFLLMSNGKRILYDDHKVKSYLEEIENADLEDMLAQPYPLGKVTQDPLQDFNPGGGRQIDFFKAVYGRDKIKVSENLIEVNFLRETVLFNRRNSAADALKKINIEISTHLKKKPGLRKFLLPLGGTFNWRNVAGAARLSPHAFGIAIDLNSKRGVYWRWDTTGKSVFSMRQNYPLEIINAFESNDCIWGGKWFFYDLMHFEYRPEIFMKNRIILNLIGYYLLGLNLHLLLL